MFCPLLGQDIRRAFTGPLVLWFYFLIVVAMCDPMYAVETIHGPC